VHTVPLTELAADRYAEFPDRPPVWQAADSKWLDWWQPLAAAALVLLYLQRQLRQGWLVDRRWARRRLLEQGQQLRGGHPLGDRGAVGAVTRSC
jgi:hypothetical protein